MHALAEQCKFTNWGWTSENGKLGHFYNETWKFSGNKPLAQSADVGRLFSSPCWVIFAWCCSHTFSLAQHLWPISRLLGKLLTNSAGQALWFCCFTVLNLCPTFGISAIKTTALCQNSTLYQVDKMLYCWKNYFQC